MQGSQLRRIYIKLCIACCPIFLVSLASVYSVVTQRLRGTFDTFLFTLMYSFPVFMHSYRVWSDLQKKLLSSMMGTLFRLQTLFFCIRVFLILSVPTLLEERNIRKNIRNKNQKCDPFILCFIRAVALYLGE